MRVRNATQILYLEEGRVAGRGTHEELLEWDGAYAPFCVQDGRASSNYQEVSVPIHWMCHPRLWACDTVKDRPSDHLIYTRKPVGVGL